MYQLDLSDRWVLGVIEGEVIEVWLLEGCFSSSGGRITVNAGAVGKERRAYDLVIGGRNAGLMAINSEIVKNMR